MQKHHSLLQRETFRKYDIRGVCGVSIDSSVISLVSSAFMQIVAKRLNVDFSKLKIVVGFDGRVSSVELFNACTKAINNLGVDVIAINLCATPMLYFASRYLMADAAIMITGSHNPPEWNGMKLVFQNKPFYGDDLQDIYRYIIDNRLDSIQDGDMVRLGTVTYHDLTELYANRVLDDLNTNKKLRICFDCGNGATGVVIEKISTSLRELGHVVMTLYSEIDGTFPNHHPDPAVEKNMRALSTFVVENNYDVGIAFDGDGDRVGFVDNLGRYICSDKFLYIMARDILQRSATGANKYLIFDVKSSKGMFDELKKLGANIVVSKTGHVYIKELIVKYNAAFGAEASGHVCFADKYYGFDDGVYSAMRFIDILSNTDKTSAQLYNDAPNYCTTHEIKLMTSNEAKFHIVDNIKKHLLQMNIKFIDIDGVRVEHLDRWWLLRASNTQDCIIVICEANSGDILEKCKNEVKSYLALCGYADLTSF